jgi:excinuclease ABC subunit C
MNKVPQPSIDMNPERLQKTLPDRPGVYLFKDDSGTVIYVGKAKDLRKRVLSYFKAPGDLPHKTALMMRWAEHLDFIITSTEKEAFILESNLIKQFMPRYNIILRDDKQYPCLRLNVKEPYPRLTIARRIKKDGALYFGPFSSAQSVRSTLKVIDRVFQLRKCKGRGLPKRARPCLNHQMDLCYGPCTQDIPVSQYQAVLRQVILFLEGRSGELIRHLEREMKEASENLEFEKCARIRDQIRAVKKTVERQHMVSPRLEDQDIIGLAQHEGLYQVVVLFVRRGYMTGSRNYRFRNPGGQPSEVMEAFIKQYYHRESFIPKQIIISDPIEDLLSITEWLCDLAEKKVVIHRPRRGEKLRLVKMAVANAENLLEAQLEPRDEDVISHLQSVLKLKKAPRRIEGLDISNLKGDMAVGSVVSFLDATPHGPGYRNYKIKQVQGIDDYGMMVELVSRRVSKGQLPDLFVVDGGKGHLMAVKRALDRQGLSHIPEVVSIAKAHEGEAEKRDKVFLVGRKNPLKLNADHPVLLLMMRIRDEAHRRAVGYHRKLSRNKLRESELDHIPGVGARRKQLLFKHFKDLDSMARASVDELAGVPGISQSLAERILRFLRTRAASD